MSANITKVDKNALRTLLIERLANPEKYLSKPLIIWRADVRDGIQEVIIREALKEHNTPLDKAEHKGFAVNPVRANADHLGICAINVGDVYTATLDKYRGKVPMVVYANLPEPAEWVYADFGNAESYIFQPDFKEWASSLRKTKYNDAVIEFIKQIPDNEGITYRWYNYFDNADCRGRRTGCDFPSCWLSALTLLKLQLKVSGCPRLCDIPDADFDRCLRPGISADLAKQFHEFLKSIDL